jgi:hypothetical protein
LLQGSVTENCIFGIFILCITLSEWKIWACG